MWMGRGGVWWVSWEEIFSLVAEDVNCNTNLISRFVKVFSNLLTLLDRKLIFGQ
jgi:chemotaxis signal transduction protein